MNKAYIKEIFSSIQGEGPYIGEMHLFVRFCNCNLNCKYCDTKFKKDKYTRQYSSQDLAQYLLHNEVDTISLTGGEPLIEVKFLKEFLALVSPHKTIYLETNGILTNELASVIDYIDIISADIKLYSATKQENQFDINDEFLSIAKKKECFIKVVYDENITKDEISNVIRIAKKHNLLLILQPMMRRNTFASENSKLVEIFKNFNSIYKNTRLIPQMHKFLRIM